MNIAAAANGRRDIETACIRLDAGLTTGTASGRRDRLAHRFHSDETMRKQAERSVSTGIL
ncbi:hypothetical protein FHS76_003915 [Ochrobactrum daejeonense]|uniref:Uncharacterized protein n=1 Tax=Brucella daejeonensis TaxID=659015 RepID=A0A7W9B0H8_9HYPH|nr:hypothetical protein [Brucella daejeonensis]MBB5704000.1 hypothetical protein [Brucella daejeonensis]